MKILLIIIATLLASVAFMWIWALYVIHSMDKEINKLNEEDEEKK